MRIMTAFILTLPPSIKKQAIEYLDKVEKPFWEKIRKTDVGFREPFKGASEVYELLDKISDLLHKRTTQN